MSEKMKIEIWSDIVCPWCYIGKRKFEQALSSFEHAKDVIIEYKSYQLDPSMQTDTKISIAQYLSDKKGIDLTQAQQMLQQVSTVASSVGLAYQLEKTIPINTLKAHAVLHYAKTVGKQTLLKERLMKAYFIETLNLDDTGVLIQLASEVGLDEKSVSDVIEQNLFAKEVQFDIQEGVNLGLQGVPFFVFNRKYGVAGAQDVTVFLQTLQKAFDEWQKDYSKTTLKTIDGKTCSVDGNCE